MVAIKREVRCVGMYYYFPIDNTAGPRSFAQFYMITSYIKWVNASWTYITTYEHLRNQIRSPRNNDPIYILSYYIKWVTTSGTYSVRHPALSLWYNVEIIMIYDLWCRSAGLWTWPSTQLSILCFHSSGMWASEKYHNKTSRYNH